ncbi:MAG: GDSL-type esterase/lipase family protein [Bacteroidales bacterium]|nr:GDSL-type esterase/lipase family protein [Bacteroidales bacterium]
MNRKTIWTVLVLFLSLQMLPAQTLYSPNADIIPPCYNPDAHLGPLPFMPCPIDTPACLKHDSLKLSLQYPSGNRDKMEQFYNKLSEVMQKGEGNINILHIGGSHVQAGDLSHTLRTRLTEMVPNLVGDHGMLFPFRALKTNGPWNYRLNYEGRWQGTRNVLQTPLVDLGLSGTAAITADSSARLHLNLREEGKWDFTQLHIFGEASDPSVYPIVITQQGDTLYATQTLLQQKDYSIFNLYADGLNQPGYHFILPQADSVCTIAIQGLSKVKPEPVRKKGQKRPQPNYSPLDSAHYFVMRGLLPQSNRSGITYSESGINGASVPSWLRCSEQHFCDELSAISPDLVIFGIGINDANVPKAEFDSIEFKAQYRELIGRIHKINPNACFLFITNNDCWLNTPRIRRVPNPNTATIVEAFYALAREHDSALFDVFGLMGGFKSADKWVKAGMMKKDHIHFTRQGYFLTGNLLYNALLRDMLQRTKE